MSFSEQKITDAEIEEVGVVSQPNKLAGTAQQNKEVFDALVKLLVKVRFNALIDELLGVSAAGQIGIDSIGGLTATSVQAALEEIMENIQIASVENLVDGSVTTAKLDDTPGEEAVATGVIRDLAVTTAKIALLAVTTGLIANGAVTTAKLDDTEGTEAVATSVIRDGAVTSVKLDQTPNAQAVSTDTIRDRAVTSDKIGNNAVIREKIRDKAVNADKIDNNAVTFDKLHDFISFDAAANTDIYLYTKSNSRALLFVAGTSASYAWAVSANGSNATNAIHLGGTAGAIAGTTGQITLPNDSGGAAKCLLIVLGGTVSNKPIVI